MMINNNMDLLSIPFHQHMNIKKSDVSGYIFETETRPEYLNHLGTIHACVQLSLAEATSGAYLLAELDELKAELIPVVRRTEAKYRKPAYGNLYSRAGIVNARRDEILNELRTKSKSMIKVRVEVFDANSDLTLNVLFDWFIKRISDEKS